MQLMLRYAAVVQYCTMRRFDVVATEVPTVGCSIRSLQSVKLVCFVKAGLVFLRAFPVEAKAWVLPVCGFESHLIHRCVSALSCGALRGVELYGMSKTVSEAGRSILLYVEGLS
jgi:hypothetical protein